MRIVRETETICPQCGRDIPGRVILDEDCAYLDRDCPDHGPCRLLLSKNGEAYADLDQFYFRLKGEEEAQGRITNYWVLITTGCQIKCAYCTLELDNTFYEEMSLEAFKEAMAMAGNSKLTLSGGEPTVHPQLFEFIEAAKGEGMLVQLATNGVALASMDFCKRLVKAQIEEVRVSIDSFEDKETEALGTRNFHQDKLKALENLREIGLTTSLSPTIFKGLNEEQLVACLDYANDKPFLRSLSVNGFSWVGGGESLNKDNMMMPDEMMDLLYAHFAPEERESGFVFQKVLLALMHVLQIRLCLYTQIMIFVRKPTGIRPITDYLNMRRLKKTIGRWEKHASSGRAVQALRLIPVLISALRLKTLLLLPACIRLLIANLFQISISRYPSKLFPVVLNTNCSTLNADASVGKQCMSGNLYVQQGAVRTGYSTQSLLNKERKKRRANSAG